MDDRYQLSATDIGKLKIILRKFDDHQIENFSELICAELIIFVEASSEREGELSRTQLLAQLQSMRSHIKHFISLVDSETSQLSKGQLSELSSRFMVEQHRYNANDMLSVQDMKRFAYKFENTLIDWEADMASKKSARNDSYYKEQFVLFVHRCWMKTIKEDVKNYENHVFWQVIRIIGPYIKLSTSEPHKTFYKLLGK